jgi:hypothetical protein
VAVLADGIVLKDDDRELDIFWMGLALEVFLENTHWTDPMIKRRPRNNTIHGA